MAIRTTTRVGAGAVAILISLGLVGCGPEEMGRRDAGDARGDIGVADTPGADEGVDAGAACRNNADCDNGVYCDGEERCLGGHCQASTPPCDDRRSCTTDSCDEAMRSCGHVADNSMCGDMNACNGVERCDPAAPNSHPTTGCTPVRTDNVVDCDDANNCTVDTCDMRVGCVHSPRDLDGDGHVDRMCTIDGTPGGPAGDDCNDGDPTTFPGAPEVCDDNRDNNCNGSIDFAEATCRPSNDTCATATNLPGPGTYWGSTVGLTDNYMLPCNPGALADAAFTFTLGTTQDVTVSTSTPTTNAAVALLPDGDCATVTAIRCNRGGSSLSPQVRVRSLPPGRYRVLVETGSTPQAFRITLRFDMPTTSPPEDSCPRMEPNPAVELNDGMPHRAQLAMLENDHTLSCNSGPSGSGRDAVFRLTIAATSDVTLTAVPTTSPSTSTFMSFRNSPCGADTSERRCTNGFSTTGAVITNRNLPPGTYWVIVENNGDSDVNVTASVVPSRPPAVGDTCPGQIVTPGGPLVTVPSANVLRGADVGTACRSVTSDSSYSDAVFQFTLTAPRDVILTGSTSTGTTAYMQVFSTCGTRGSAIAACISGNPATRRLAGLMPGTYYVVLEASTGTVSPIPDFRLTVTATDPALRPAAEACPGLAARTDGTPVVINWGTTGAMGSVAPGPDVGTNCASRGTSTAYRDVVVSYTLTAASDVEIVFDGGATGIYRDVRTSCNDFMSFIPTIPCQYVTSARTHRIRSQPPGTYYIVGETSLTSPTSPLTIRVTATPPAPIVNYVVSASPMGVSYVDVCGMPTAGRVLSSSLGGTAAVPVVPLMLPFPVRVYGINVTGPMTVSTYGWMSFNTGETGSLSGTIPSPTAPNFFISPYWSYFRASASGVCYTTTGTAPNRRFIVEWRDLNEIGSASSVATFEVVVNEAAAGTNNTIDVVYQRMDALIRAGATAGIENDDGSLGTLIAGPYMAPRVVRLTPM